MFIHFPWPLDYLQIIFRFPEGSGTDSFSVTPSEDISEHALRRAYRLMVKESHPDKGGSAKAATWFFKRHLQYMVFHMVFRRKHACHMLSLCHCQNGLMMIEVDQSWLMIILLQMLNYFITDSVFFRRSAQHCRSNAQPNRLLEVTELVWGRTMIPQSWPRLWNTKWKLKQYFVKLLVLPMYEWIGLRSLRENLNRKPLLHCFSYGIWGCPVIFPLNKSIDCIVLYCSWSQFLGGLGGPFFGRWFFLRQRADSWADLAAWLLAPRAVEISSSESLGCDNWT